MKTQLNMQDKLLRKKNRLENEHHDVYHATLQQFMSFLRKQPVLMGIIESLINNYPGAQKEAESIVNKRATLAYDNEHEHFAVTYHVLYLCSKSQDKIVEANIGRNYHFDKTYNNNLLDFNRIFTTPFIDFLIEELEEQSEVLSLLVKYKQKCEWFQRSRLYDMWVNDTVIGEKLLAYDMYEYLHENNIIFNIEPLSVSGEIDMIARQGTEDPLLADAKIFNTDRSKGSSYIKKGVSQLYNYMCDYNESVGYLVIFTTCEKNVYFNLEKKQGVPRLFYCNRSIFFVVIDIFPHSTSASHRKPTDFVNINEDYLTTNIMDEE